MTHIEQTEFAVKVFKLGVKNKATYQDWGAILLMLLLNISTNFTDRNSLKYVFGVHKKGKSKAWSRI